jgi:hypothetical protein
MPSFTWIILGTPSALRQGFSSLAAPEGGGAKWLDFFFCPSVIVPPISLAHKSQGRDPCSSFWKLKMRKNLGGTANIVLHICGPLELALIDQKL